MLALNIKEKRSIAIVDMLPIFQEHEEGNTNIIWRIVNAFATLTKTCNVASTQVIMPPSVQTSVPDADGRIVIGGQSVQAVVDGVLRPDRTIQLVVLFGSVND